MIPNNPSPDKKDVSMETRLLLAFLLTGLLLFLTQYFYKPEPVPVTKSANKTAETAPAAARPAQGGSPAAPASSAATTSSAAPAHAATPAVPIPGAIHAEKEEIFTVDTKLYRVTFSNKGAVATSWILKDYKDDRGKPVELVNQKALEKTGAPFSLVVRDAQLNGLAATLNEALYRASPSPDGLGIDYVFSDGRTAEKKSFRFQRGSYLSQVSSELATNGVAVPHQLAWRGGFGDPTVANPDSVEHALYFDMAGDKLHSNPAKDAKKGPVTASGDFSFAGLEDSFFAAVFLPKSNSSVEITTYSDTVPTLLSQKDLALVGAAVGGSGDNRFSLYAGPKDIQILAKVDPKLEQVVDWGWYKILAKPLFLVLNWTAEHVVRNYGWAIVVVTVAINMLLLPLKFTSLKSARKMQELQPEIKKINDKYKNVGLRDPKKQHQNEEIMELYKKHGANPLGGCMPMVLQIPFFYAFYKVLTVAIQLRGADWLWVADLSRAENLPIRILPVILIVTQFASQKMTPTSTAMDPTQQKMMMIMPLAMGFMFYYQPAGLVLYWLTGNLVGIGQQWLINRISGTPQAAAPAAKPAVAKRKSTRN